MKKNSLESKLDAKLNALKSPPVDEKLDRKPVVKLIVIAMIVLVALGMLIYIVSSMVSAYRASTQPGATQSQTESLDCRMVSSAKPGGDPAHCETSGSSR
ncbi:hypothetical protein GOB93_11590 [Acetobacter musti]|uniref:Uncharacterized protein n=1 Tax=Acetobacter musti TaxID=864732 RepID=A0ABX0JTJ9_9PROT|nr:hypothetical protein [Acetobacter musti]NHN85280.1 hypothetical protein [Acetobacter musti]